MRTDDNEIQRQSTRETIGRLARDLSGVLLLLLIIFFLPAVAVLPIALNGPAPAAFVQAVRDVPVCAGAQEGHACRRVAYAWRSGWRDWNASWYLPELWIQHSIQESNAAAEAASRRSGPVDDLSYWSAIYARTARMNRDRVRVYARGFLDLAGRYDLSRRAVLELVIGFVQSMEYAIPANYLQLYAPPRLLALGQGDCDSRALLLVLLLEEMNYDAVLLLSPYYRHAMVGVRCEWCEGAIFRGPNGIAYSFVETTARTPPGFLHPAVRELVYWHSFELP